MSDVVIGYTIRGYGGACTALHYAEKRGREIIDISRMKEWISVVYSDIIWYTNI